MCAYEALHNGNNHLKTQSSLLIFSLKKVDWLFGGKRRKKTINSWPDILLNLISPFNSEGFTMGELFLFLFNFPKFFNNSFAPITGNPFVTFCRYFNSQTYFFFSLHENASWGSFEIFCRSALGALYLRLQDKTVKTLNTFWNIPIENESQSGKCSVDNCQDMPELALFLRAGNPWIPQITEVITGYYRNALFCCDLLERNIARSQKAAHSTSHRLSRCQVVLPKDCFKFC